MKNLAYHRSCYRILGKNHVYGIIHKVFGSTPGDISTWSDYDERSSFEPDGQLQNELFDKNNNLSVESCCLDRFRKIVNTSNFCEAI